MYVALGTAVGGVAPRLLVEDERRQRRGSAGPRRGADAGARAGRRGRRCVGPGADGPRSPIDVDPVALEGPALATLEVEPHQAHLVGHRVVVGPVAALAAAAGGEVADALHRLDEAAAGEVVAGALEALADDVEELADLRGADLLGDRSAGVGGVGVDARLVRLGRRRLGRLALPARPDGVGELLGGREAPG